MRNHAVTLSLFGLLASVMIAYFAVLYLGLDSGWPLHELLDRSMQQVEAREWEDAEETVEEIIRIWNRWKYFAMLNVAEQDFQTFESALARLRGAIRIKDESLAVSEVLVAKLYLSIYTKIVPLP